MLRVDVAAKDTLHELAEKKRCELQQTVLLYSIYTNEYSELCTRTVSTPPPQTGRLTAATVCAHAMSTMRVTSHGSVLEADCASTTLSPTCQVASIHSPPHKTSRSLIQLAARTPRQSVCCPRRPRQYLRLRLIKAVQYTSGCLMILDV